MLSRELPQKKTAMGKSGETPTSLDFMWRSFLAGGVAGMCSKTAVAPLDRIKILLQAHSKHYKSYGVFSGLKEIVCHESFLALYKGNGAQMVRIFPYAAVQFTTYEIYKKYLPRFFGNYSHVASFLSGSCAGVSAVCLTYPLDTIRARLAFQVTGEHVLYKGIVHAGVQIFKQEGGLRALYRGFLPTVCGMVPYAGSSFYCFEMLKFACMKYIPHITCNKHSRNTGGMALNVPSKLICGGLAGAVAQSLSYPLDVTRRRMQLAMMNPETQKFAVGMFRTLVLIYRENGIVSGLYRGMSINYLRAMPMVAVSFSTYELMKQLLNMDTGLAISKFGLPASAICIPRSLHSCLFLYETIIFLLRMCERLLLYAIYLLGFFPGISPCGFFTSLTDSYLNLNEFGDGFPQLKYSTSRDAVDGFLAPVKYHATVFLQKYTVMDTPMNSACIKCGICLAVSEKLEQILGFALKSAISLHDFDDSLSAQLLRPICDFAFQSYGLKEWNGFRVISQYQFLDSVPNSLEGRWWEVLKNACHFYLTHFGDGNLVRAWLLESQNVTRLLCRNDGLFRDCLNIEQGVLTIQSPQRFLLPKNFVEITYPCA